MPRTVVPLPGNTQKLDGGAMYGHCPRALWARWTPPDADGRIDLACRAMGVEEEDGRFLLFETGVGAFFPPALKARYGVVEERHVLLDSLAAHGRGHADVDVVVLSHLHFDHAGGLLSAFEEGREPSLLFPRARFVVSRRAFERALRPHRRDRASFVPGLAERLEATGRLELVEGETSDALGTGYRFHTSEGHTPGLLMTEVATDAGPLVFVSDLVPARPWMRPAITMGYDRFPERLVDEKRALLEDLAARGGSVFFTHDPEVAVFSVPVG